MTSTERADPTAGIFPDGMPGLSVRWVDTGGWRARCIESGPPTEPPIVMLPGWGCTAYSYRHNLLAFAEHGWRAIVVEPPGQGWSDKPLEASAYTLPSLARGVADVLDQLGIGAAPVIGQSLGGGVALQLALDSPDRVQSLALWNPIGFGCTRLVHAGALIPVSMAPFFEQVIGPRLVRHGMELVYGPGHPPTDEDVRQYAAPIGSDGFVRAQIELLRNVDWAPLPTSDRRRLTLPIVIVTGTADILVPRHCLADAAETLPDARLHVTEGAGHAANETHAADVNQATLSFLRS